MVLFLIIVGYLVLGVICVRVFWHVIDQRDDMESLTPGTIGLLALTWPIGVAVSAMGGILWSVGRLAMLGRKSP